MSKLTQQTRGHKQNMSKPTARLCARRVQAVTRHPLHKITIENMADFGAPFERQSNLLPLEYELDLVTHL